jgi:hypothetical protein
MASLNLAGGTSDSTSVRTAFSPRCASREGGVAPLLLGSRCLLEFDFVELRAPGTDLHV